MSENIENNVRSVLQLLTMASGGGDVGRRRLFYRTLGGPVNLPEVVQKIEMIQSIKNALPPQIHDIVDSISEMLENSLISLTSVKGATLQMLTTQKSEFKVNHPALRRGLGPKMFGGGEGGGGGQMGGGGGMMG